MIRTVSDVPLSRHGRRGWTNARAVRQRIAEKSARGTVTVYSFLLTTLRDTFGHGRALWIRPAAASSGSEWFHTSPRRCGMGHLCGGIRQADRCTLLLETWSSEPSPSSSVVLSILIRRLILSVPALSIAPVLQHHRRPTSQNLFRWVADGLPCRYPSLQRFSKMQNAKWATQFATPSQHGDPRHRRNSAPAYAKNATTDATASLPGHVSITAG